MSKLEIDLPHSDGQEPAYVAFYDLEDGEIFEWISPDHHGTFLMKIDGDKAIELSDGTLYDDSTALAESMVYRVDAKLRIIKIHR